MEGNATAKPNPKENTQKPPIVRYGRSYGKKGGGALLRKAGNPSELGVVKDYGRSLIGMGFVGYERKEPHRETIKFEKWHYPSADRIMDQVCTVPLGNEILDILL